jgi:hypothetical protein
MPADGPNPARPKPPANSRAVADPAMSRFISDLSSPRAIYVLAPAACGILASTPAQDRGRDDLVRSSSSWSIS